MRWWNFALLLWFADTFFMCLASYFAPEITTEFSFYRFLRTGWWIHCFIEKVIQVVYSAAVYSLIICFVKHVCFLISKYAWEFGVVMFLAVFSPLLVFGFEGWTLESYMRKLDTTVGLSLLFMYVFAGWDFFFTITSIRTPTDVAIETLHMGSGAPLTEKIERKQNGKDLRTFMGWCFIAIWPCIFFLPLVTCYILDE